MCLSAPHCDDIQIYWLTRNLGKGETILADDPLYYAKTGRVVRHPTEPELALQAAQEFTDQAIPPKWCKIGTSVAKAATACISGDFVFASVYDGKGNRYHWQNIDSVGERSSSRSKIPVIHPVLEASHQEGITNG